MDSGQIRRREKEKKVAFVSVAGPVLDALNDHTPFLWGRHEPI